MKKELMPFIGKLFIISKFFQIIIFITLNNTTFT